MQADNKAEKYHRHSVTHSITNGVKNNDNLHNNTTLLC